MLLRLQTSDSLMTVDIKFSTKVKCLKILSWFVMLDFARKKVNSITFYSVRIRRPSLNQIQLEAPSISFFLNKNPGIYNFLCVTTPQTRRGETQICVKKLVSPERLLDKRGSKMKVCFGLKSPREEFVASVAL